MGNGVEGHSFLISDLKGKVSFSQSVVLAVGALWVSYVR